MIKVLPLGMAPSHNGSFIRPLLAAKAHIAFRVDDFVRLARPSGKSQDDESIATEISHILGHTLSCEGMFTFTQPDGKELPLEELYVGSFDADTNVFIIGYFVGEEYETDPFWGMFDLTGEERRQIQEETIGIIVVHMPESEEVTMQALAVAAIGEHGVDYDAYAMPRSTHNEIMRVIAEKFPDFPL